MPRGQKECPKCNIACGPRTKICENCGYIYIKDSPSSLEDSDEYDTVNIKAAKAKCVNCSLDFESISYKIDAYGTVTHKFAYDNYCCSFCLEEANERKDDLISELLENTQLTDFFSNKKESIYYKLLIEYIINRRAKLALEEIYNNTHPDIVFTSFPKKRLETVRDCEEVGIKVPPKIGDYQEAEEEQSELDILVFGEKEATLPKGSVELKVEPKTESLDEMFSLITSKTESTIQEKPQVIAIQSTKTFEFDHTPNTRGQKKCKGCGDNNGVRSSNCKRCNKAF